MVITVSVCTNINKQHYLRVGIVEVPSIQMRDIVRSFISDHVLGVCAESARGGGTCRDKIPQMHYSTPIICKQ